MFPKIHLIEVVDEAAGIGAAEFACMKEHDVGFINIVLSGNLCHFIVRRIHHIHPAAVLDLGDFLENLVVSAVYFQHDLTFFIQTV